MPIKLSKSLQPEGDAETALIAAQRQAVPIRTFILLLNNFRGNTVVFSK